MITGFVDVMKFVSILLALMATHYLNSNILRAIIIVVVLVIPIIPGAA